MIRWLPFVVWLLILFGISSIPDLSVGPDRAPGFDKLLHVGAYSVLGALFGFATRTSRSTRALWTGALVGLGVGTLDELYQSTVPGREVDAFDALADVIGVMLGAWVWSAWTQHRRRTMLS